MIKIELPESLVEITANGKIVEQQITAVDLIRSLVLTLPFWKEESKLEKIDAYLEIQNALDIDPMNPLISIEARNFLKDAMTLRLPNSSYATIPNARADRFYMKMYRAVIVAKNEEKNG